MPLSQSVDLDLERARLALRARGISVDRGRLVREAIAALLADLDSGVEASVLARRLQGPGPPVNGNGLPGQAPVTPR